MVEEHCLTQHIDMIGDDFIVDGELVVGYKMGRR